MGERSESRRRREKPAAAAGDENVLLPSSPTGSDRSLSAMRSPRGKLLSSRDSARLRLAKNKLHLAKQRTFLTSPVKTRAAKKADRVPPSPFSISSRVCSRRDATTTANALFLRAFSETSFLASGRRATRPPRSRRSARSRLTPNGISIPTTSTRSRLGSSARAGSCGARWSASRARRLGFGRRTFYQKAGATRRRRTRARRWRGWRTSSPPSWTRPRV